MRRKMYRGRVPGVFTPEESAVILKMRTDGKGWTTISKKLRTHHENVRNHAVEFLGLTPNLPGRAAPGQPIKEASIYRQKMRLRRKARKENPSAFRHNDDRFSLPPGSPESWDVISREAWPGLTVEHEPMRMAA